MKQRIYIFGASGSGTTTLASELASRLHIPHFDMDDYFWFPTDPPYTTKRKPEERKELIIQDLGQLDSWIISGSMIGWGDFLLPKIELAVYLYVPHEARMNRLEKRERERYGRQIAPGGSRYAAYLEFMAWARQYDTAGLEMRSRSTHAKWMESFQCPVVRYEGLYTLDYLVEEVMNLGMAPSGPL